MGLESECANQATARSGKFEVFNGEWEVVIAGIVDEETVVDILLQTLGFVASWDQRARVSSSIGVAFLDAGVLIKLDSVRFDLVDNDTPFTFDVDSSKRLDVSGRARAKVSLLLELGQGVDRVGGVGCYVLVQSYDGIVVLVKSVDDIVGRIFGIFQTPGFGGVLGTGRNLGFVFVVLVGLVVRHTLVVRCRCFVGRVAGHHSYNTQAQTNLKK